LGKGRRSRSDQRRREEIVEAKGEKGRRGRRNSVFFFSEENIFFICKMMREIVIITIMEASNNEKSVLRTERTRGEGRYCRNMLRKSERKKKRDRRRGFPVSVLFHVTEISRIE